MKMMYRDVPSLGLKEPRFGVVCDAPKSGPTQPKLESSKYYNKIITTKHNVQQYSV